MLSMMYPGKVIMPLTDDVKRWMFEKKKSDPTRHFPSSSFMTAFTLDELEEFHRWEKTIHEGYTRWVEENPLLRKWLRDSKGLEHFFICASEDGWFQISDSDVELYENWKCDLRSRIE